MLTSGGNNHNYTDYYEMNPEHGVAWEWDKSVFLSEADHEIILNYFVYSGFFSYLFYTFEIKPQMHMLLLFP